MVVDEGRLGFVESCCVEREEVVEQKNSKGDEE